MRPRQQRLLLPQTRLLEEISPSSAVTARVEVPMARLDALELLERPAWRRLFLMGRLGDAELIGVP